MVRVKTPRWSFGPAVGMVVLLVASNWILPVGTVTRGLEAAVPRLGPSLAVATPSVASSTDTLVLYNGSRLPGDQDATGANGQDPTKPGYDPESGQVWVSLFFAEGLTARTIIKQINVSTDRAEALVYYGNSAPTVRDFVYDATDHHFDLVDLGGHLIVLNATAPFGTVATVPAGSQPIRAIWDPTNDRIYVATSQGVSVIDGRTNTLTTSIRIAGYPSDLAYVPTTNELYVVGSSNVSILNLTSNTVVTTLPRLISGFGGVAFDPESNRVLVTTGNKSIDVIDPLSRSVVQNLTIGGFPVQIVYDGAMHAMVINNDGGTNITFVNATTYSILGVRSLGTRSTGLVYAPQVRRLYASGFSGDNVTVLDGATDRSIASVPLGASPISIVADPAAGLLFVPDDTLGGTWVVRTGPASVVGFVPTGSWGNSITYVVREGGTVNPANGRVVLAFSRQANLTELDPGTLRIARTIPTNISPVDVALNARNGELVAAGSNGLGFYNATTGAIVHWTNISRGQDVLFDPGTGDVYATAGDTQIASTGTVYRISSTTGNVVAQQTVTAAPGPMALDPSNGRLFVVSSGGIGTEGNVTVLSDSTLAVLKVIRVPASFFSRPNGIAYNSASNVIAVSEAGSSTLYEFDASTYAIRSSYPVPTYPGGVAYLPGIDATVVASQGSGSLHFFYGPPGPVITSFLASPTSLPARSSTTLSTTVAGGSGSYSYRYDGLPPGCSTANRSRLDCTPTATGAFKVTVNVTDSLHASAVANLTLTVTPPAVAQVAFTITPPTCGPITVNGTTYPNGGGARFPLGTYNVSYPPCAGYVSARFLATGNLSVLGTTLHISGNGTLSLVYLAAGRYFVEVTVVPTSCGAAVLLNNTAVGPHVLVALAAGLFPLSHASCAYAPFGSWTTAGAVGIEGSQLRVHGDGALNASFSTNESTAGSWFGSQILYPLIAVAVVAVGVAIFAIRRRRVRSTETPSEIADPAASGEELGSVNP